VDDLRRPHERAALLHHPRLVQTPGVDDEAEFQAFVGRKIRGPALPRHRLVMPAKAIRQNMLCSTCSTRARDSIRRPTRGDRGRPRAHPLGRALRPASRTGEPPDAVGARPTRTPRQQVDARHVHQRRAYMQEAAAVAQRCPRAFRSTRRPACRRRRPSRPRLSRSWPGSAGAEGSTCSAAPASAHGEQTDRDHMHIRCSSST
jgi:hypothetical protein